jgi:hypothetical protein
MIYHCNTCKKIHVQYLTLTSISFFQVKFRQKSSQSDITSSFWPMHNLCACFHMPVFDRTYYGMASGGRAASDILNHLELKNFYSYSVGFLHKGSLGWPLLILTCVPYIIWITRINKGIQLLRQAYNASLMLLFIIILWL